MVNVSITSAQEAPQMVDCNNVDLSAYNDLVTQANTALASGDMATALQAVKDARTMLRNIESQCLASPVVTELGAQNDVNLSDLLASPSCQYRFDATVRTGSDKGVYLHGTLGLVQNGDTSAVGYVVPDDPNADPVQAQLGEDQAITLTFSLPDGTSIVGMGTMDTTIAGCFGTMEGTFTGLGCRRQRRLGRRTILLAATA